MRQVPDDSRANLFLMYCPQGHGGLAEYAHLQAKALHELGVPVRLVAARDFLDRREASYPIDRILPSAPIGTRGLWRKMRHAWWLASVPWRFAAYVRRTRPRNVHLAAYSEYMSPLWVWPHRALRRRFGIRYGANLHDPVRDFQVGPRWWHRLSVRLAFDALDYVIVHEAELDPGVVPGHIAVHEAPCGLFELAKASSEAGRTKLCEGKNMRVLLCFGHIRDNKNIDLLIRALPHLPHLHLVVAGPPAAGSQRPEVFYRDLARQLGVEQRFEMIAKFIADGEVATYFEEADWIAVTYSASFRSQSAVLNVAARARKQVLASSGPSPMRAAVERFGLGVFVEPDSTDAIVRGVRELMEHAPVPDWEGYERYASWAQNARTVIAAARAAR